MAPDLSNHPSREAVHFGETSGIPGVHIPPQPPEPRPQRGKRRDEKPDAQVAAETPTSEEAA